MQNEERINVLETQVRTLKRVVCLMCCLFASTMFAGCSATSKSTDKDNLAQDKDMNYIQNQIVNRLSKGNYN
jgi:uncharacterized lipoprotein YajG